MKRIASMASCLLFVLAVGCGGNKAPDPAGIPVSRAGISATRADIHPGADGLTVEQRNVKRRIEMDNRPGVIKHLYVISPYSGQTLFYSTVKGKITSSGKRLSPYTVAAGVQRVGDMTRLYQGFPVDISGRREYTGEVLQDDGTYGSSAEYIFWFDARDNYHQHFVSGGQIVHVSDHPIPVKSVVINLELGHGNE